MKRNDVWMEPGSTYINIWRLTKKPISSTPSLGPLSRGENTLPSLPEWSWTPNLPGKRQNCAHGDCQSCTLPKWLFASKILTLVTSWSGPTGPDGGLRALRYNWAKQLAAIIGPHDPLCMIWKHMRMWMHIVQILLSCAVFITEFVFRYFHPRNHMLGKIQRDGLWQHHKFGLLLPAHILHDCNASWRKLFHKPKAIWEQYEHVWAYRQLSWRTKPESYYDDRIITISNSACPRQNATTKLWLCASSRCEHDASTKMPWDVLVRSWILKIRILLGMDMARYTMQTIHQSGFMVAWKCHAKIPGRLKNGAIFSLVVRTFRNFSWWAWVAGYITRVMLDWTWHNGMGQQKVVKTPKVSVMFTPDTPG